MHLFHNASRTFRIIKMVILIDLSAILTPPVTALLMSRCEVFSESHCNKVSLKNSFQEHAIRIEKYSAILTQKDKLLKVPMGTRPATQSIAIVIVVTCQYSRNYAWNKVVC